MDISTGNTNSVHTAQTDARHIAPFSGILLSFGSDDERAEFRRAVGQAIRADKLWRGHRLIDYPRSTAATTMTVIEVGMLCHEHHFRFAMPTASEAINAQEAV